jgi:hypothetical protein
MNFRSVCSLVCLIIFLSLTTNAQLLSSDQLQGMKWRMIGPFRGGRTVGATGVPGQPNVFYIGVNNGGVWKTNDYGHTWKPIFDDQPTGSIGALAVAPSNPKLFMLEVVKVFNAPTCRPVMEYTSRPMAAKHGGTWVFATRNRLAQSLSTPGIQISSTLLHSVTRTARTKNGECFAPLMAEKRGTRSYIRTRTQERSLSLSTRRTRKLSMQTCGQHGRGRGKTGRFKDPEVVCTRLRTAVIPGIN